MDYVELIIRVNPVEPGMELLIAALSEAGFESFAEEEELLKAYVPLKDFDEKKKSSLNANNYPGFSLSYEKKLIKGQNWNEQWENSFEPVRIKNECIIRASFHPAEEQFKHEIIIDPKMSFGTGHHSTTWLMTSKILSLNMEEKSVLDMGCGTAILAILASKNKAASVLAIDVDDWAFENALENLRLNKVNNVDVKKGGAELLKGRCFDLVLANINKNVILEDLPIYAECLNKNGNMLLSGFFEQDSADIIQQAEKSGLKMSAKQLKNKWTLLHLIKTKP